MQLPFLCPWCLPTSAGANRVALWVLGIPNQIWKLRVPSKLRIINMTKGRSGEIQGCTGTTSTREFSVFSLLLLPTQTKCSENDLPFPAARWVCSLENCLEVYSPHSFPAVSSWNLNPLRLIFAEITAKPFLHPNSSQISAQDPLPVRRALLVPTGALSYSKTILGFWNANLKPLCTKSFLKKKFPFQDITDLYNNPQIRYFLRQAAPWEVGCSGKQLPEHWAFLTQSRSQKGNGDHGGLIPKGCLVSHNIPAWKVGGSWNPGDSPHSQHTLLPPTATNLQLPARGVFGLWVNYLGLLFSLLIFHADGTRTRQPGLEFNVKGFFVLLGISGCQPGAVWGCFPPGLLRRNQPGQMFLPAQPVLKSL